MTTATLGGQADTLQIRRNDWRIIVLVGAAHACSHFVQLMLPALYLSLAAHFGYDFVQLGLLASIFFLVSGIGQASSGFLVDRVGPVPVLVFGLGCFVLACVLIGAANGYTLLLAAAAIGGIGNAVFHPVDYSILNHRVSGKRLGHAFSVHGLTGNLGWALAPVFISTITLLASWRVAAFASAALIAVVLACVWLGRGMLSGSNLPAIAPDPATGAKAVAGGQAPKASPVTLRGLLSQPALWGAFLFFAFTSIALSAVQQYTIPLFNGLYQVDRMMASSALSSYMVAAAIGMALGGFLVNASASSERVVAISLVLSGVLLAVLALGGVSIWMAVALLVLAGFFSGVAAPSRDMLVRRVTPKGATGSVYGLVYSGMDVGASLGPVMFGLMLDHGLDQGPWFGAAVCFAVGAWLAMLVARFALARERPAGQG